jgi:[ribosomal protein S5]-alanine N-acetyltransferase
MCMVAISVIGGGRGQAVLRTARLVLRPPRRGDADILAHHLSDPRVARMLTHVPLPCGRSHAAGWITGMRSEIRLGQARYYVVERGSMVIGLTGLTGLDSGVAELGYWLGHPWWGNGLMGEAVGPVLRAAWRLSELKAIEAVHMADNEASARLLLRLGFRYTGAVKLHSRARGTDVLCRTMLLERPRPEVHISGIAAASAA